MDPTMTPEPGGRKHAIPIEFTDEDHSVEGRRNGKIEPPPVPPSTGSAFLSTLQHQRNDLSEEDVEYLNRHKITQSLAERILGRMKMDSSMAEDFEPEKVPNHPELTGDASSCSESSLLGLKSRQNSAELARLSATEGQKKLHGLKGETSSTADSFNIEDSPRKLRPKLLIELPLAGLPTSSAMDDYSRSPPAEADVEYRGISLDGMEPEELNLSNQEIEGLLDTMLPHHQVEYEHDLEEIEREKKLSRQSSTSSRGSRRILRPKDFDGSSPATEEVIRSPNFQRYTGRISDRRRLSYGSTTGDSSGSETPSTTSPYTEQIPKGKAVRILTTIHNKDREEIINGIADRLIKAGRNRSLSGPPTMEGFGVLDRSSSFKTPPTGTSFATIFTVEIPRGNFKAPLTRLGRPLIPVGVTTNKYTAVATYHPSYRHLVVDLMDYCFCPAGFDSTLHVDLVYLQNIGYLPTYHTWPVQEYAAKRYEVAPEWSLCTNNADGLDILFVSDLDVMTQRIATCMFRAYEGRTMSKAAHARYLDSIADGCVDVVEAELTCMTTSLDRVPTHGTVSVDYHSSAAMDWIPLTAHPSHQLPHSRDGMPIRLS
ncbi:hypothetical protein FN846DRAFT_949461 [Sphaerosporella brunnea]|uniref:Uncharacterized protein n=1 Tax=Sphaerosporella brunnea TaxID=1250544 RepID=A0A5J5EWW4_9PEZI|nr:hypothetical protein FN846DRAFT_949461 [Sphaerosporella brunnea]